MANQHRELFNGTVTTAGTVTSGGYEFTPGTEACQLIMLARFTYGSGGTSCKAYVQTEIDGKWMDLACFAFTTSSVDKVLTVIPKEIVAAYTPTDGAITDDTALSGIFGERYRVKVVSVGTYAGDTTLQVDAYIAVGK